MLSRNLSWCAWWLLPSARLAPAPPPPPPPLPPAPALPVPPPPPPKARAVDEAMADSMPLFIKLPLALRLALPGPALPMSPASRGDMDQDGALPELARRSCSLLPEAKTPPPSVPERRWRSAAAACWPGAVLGGLAGCMGHVLLLL